MRRKATHEREPAQGKRPERTPAPSANAQDRAPMLATELPLARLKSAAGGSVDNASMAALQRALGNQAIARLLNSPSRKTAVRRAQDEADEIGRAPSAGFFGKQPVINRHWLEGEEKVQALHDPAAIRARENGAPGRRASFADPGYSQRRTEARAHRGAVLWGRPGAVAQREGEKGGAAPVVEAKKAPTGAVDAVTFAPADVPADGKTTTQAKATVSGGAAVTKWTIVGDAHGSSIDKSGIVTPGADTKGAESVALKVLATDENGGASGTGTVTLWESKFFQAKTDFPKFIASNLTFPNFTKGFNGKFDVDYSPAAKLANVNMKLKFEWPEEKPVVPDASNLWGLAPKLKQINYQINFINQVIKQWSGRFEFNNVREPKSIWGKLNPVQVKVNVRVVDADQHFTVKVHDRAVNAAKGESTAVGGGVLNLYQGDDVPKPMFNPGTGAGELARVTRITPTPVLFGKDSAVVSAADKTKLQTLGTYLSRVNNPKFDVKVEGHASKTGISADNQKLSEARAKSVVDILSGAGATNHTITGSGLGDTAAGKTDDWRKVDITSATPPGWTNMQDTTAHEFGHMIGLGDEYAAAGVPKSTHYDLVAKAFGPDYAEQVAKRGDQDSSSIMDGGDDVRIQHYVTFWSALVETTLLAATPDPKFGYDDWKFAGT